MGTRGLVGHIIRGKKKGSYNHWDSYPEGLGRKLVKFIKSLSDEQIQQMIEHLDAIVWVDEESAPPKELKTRYVDAGFCDLRVSDQSPNDWYCLLHKVQGAAALPRILDGTLGHLIESTDFENDRLFCEWAYFIDWEKRQMSVRGRGKPKVVGFEELDEKMMIESQWQESDESSGDEEEEDDETEEDDARSEEEEKEV